MASRLTFSYTTVSPAASGAELRAIRRHLALSQECFADRLGVHRTSIARWEKGRRPMPTTVLWLARYVCLAFPFPPRSAFIPVTVDPDTPSIQVSHGVQCYWQHAPEPCGGRYFYVQARLSRRRNVVSEACAVHLDTVLEAMVTTLEAAARAEQRRQAGRRRKRLARQRVREQLAAATTPTP